MTLSTSQIFPFPAPVTDCVEAHRVCSTEPQCEALYRGLELCAVDAAVAPLGEQEASECLERQDALLAKHPSLLACKCQRGFRKEERCLRIYWRVRLLPGKLGPCWGCSELGHRIIIIFINIILFGRDNIQFKQKCHHLVHCTRL